MNAIMPRATVEQIVAFRSAALELYQAAYDALNEASDAVIAAHRMAANASPGINNYNYSQEEEIKAFHSAIKLPDRDRWLRTARRLMDVNIWAYVIERTDLERLMDAEAKETLRRQMAYIPAKYHYETGALINEEEMAKGLPEPTVENIVATIEALMADSENIFKRGLANVFSKLDRRFRSHDGFKIGSRVILNYFANRDDGRVRWGGQRDRLFDIERVLHILDGQASPLGYASIMAVIDRERPGWTPHQSEHEGAYFRVRIFKNGNAHLWFTRDDLVEKANKILADWYGEVIGDEMNDFETDPLNEVKTTPAKRYGFFPTPDAAADAVIKNVQRLQRADQPPLLVLEPSAGTGNLARRMVHSREEIEAWSGRGERWEKEYRFDNQVDCVEIQPHLAADLDAEGVYRRVMCHDFLKLSPQITGLYDRVVMNPPFDRERDIDHVVHALEFLKPDGQLVAIMSAGTEFRETKKSVAFREMIAAMGGTFDDLPAGSFSEVGTNVNTLVLTVWKDGRRVRRW